MEEEFKKLDLEQKWDQHYDLLLIKSRRHSSEVGENVTNINLNRYVDVKPYDRSRVKLSRTKDTDYINANLVTVPKAARQYILTQGPLPETLAHFWLMVWEQKSTVIVMLNKILEMEDFNKCEQYWPDRVGSVDKYSQVKLNVALRSVKVEKHYTVREMLLTDEETDKSRTILQFHYTAWPDHGEPDSPTSLLRLLTAIRKSGGLDKMDEPTIVHCSAGIGRSGTFCLIDSILSMIENQGSTEGIDIDNTLLEMRDYRMGLIQSPVQLKFAYMSIIYGVKILQAANKLHPHISSIMDNIAFDNTNNTSMSQQDQSNNTNGSSQTTQNGPKKPNRRNKKKNSSSNSGSLNVFQKNLLVEALDDIDSDEADSLFYYTMRQLPNIKKPRNSSPEDLTDDVAKQIPDLMHNGTKGSSMNLSSNQQQGSSVATKAQMLDNAINSLLTENTISTSNKTSTSSMNSNTSTQTTDSVLLRRREKELRNKEMAEKISSMKSYMKARELNQERWALFKKSLVGGVAALVVSSLVYVYMNGHNGTS